MYRYIALVSLALACKPSTVANERLAAQAAKKGALSGNAYLVAPIVNAHVSVFRLAAKTPDEFVADAMTDDKGAFEIDIPVSVDGDLLVVLQGDRGGSTIEPSTSISPVTLSENDKFMSIVVGTKLGQQSIVTVNPLTTLVAARALAEFRSGTMTVKDAWQKNGELFSAHFDTPSPWNSAPIDPSTTEAPGLSSSVIYALTAVGISYWALTLGERGGVTDVTVVNTLTLLRLLVQDLGDRVFDGMADGQPLNVAGNVFLETETTRLSLAKAIEAFLASDKNKTGLTARDVTRLLNAIRQDVSELYPSNTPPEQKDETIESGAAPTIALTSPTPNQAMTKDDHIVGSALDLDGITEVVVTIDGTQVDVSYDKTNGAKWTWAFAPAVADGAHVLSISAKDAKGNVSKADASFSIDTQGPTVSFVECTAFDDRTRTATTSLSGAVYSNSATAWPCGETALNDGSQRFYGFADIVEEGERVPVIKVSVGDTSQVASAKYSVRVNDIELQAAKTLPTAASPSTHQVELSVERLGAIGSLLPSDVVSLVVEATDALGNKTSRTFRFSMSLLPTPLLVENETTDSASALTSFTFAADTIPNLSDAGYALPDGLVRLNQYKVTNISSRPELLSTTEGWANATGKYKRRWFRSYITGFMNENLSSTCAQGQLVRQQMNCRFSAGGAHVCYPVSTACTTIQDEIAPGTFSQEGSYPVKVKVYALPGGTLVTPDASGNVSIEPGKSYRIVIGTPRPGFAFNDPNLRIFVGDYYSAFTTYACGVQLYSEGYGAVGYGFQKSVPNGIYKKNRFYTLTSGTNYDFYGVVSCQNAFNCSGVNGASCYKGDGVNDTYMHAVVAGNYATTISPIILERGISYASTASWTPQIRGTLGGASIQAKGDKTGLTIAGSYNTEPPRPDFCAAYNSPYCTASLAGW